MYHILSTYVYLYHHDRALCLDLQSVKKYSGTTKATFKISKAKTLNPPSLKNKCCESREREKNKNSDQPKILESIFLGKFFMCKFQCVVKVIQI